MNSKSTNGDIMVKVTYIFSRKRALPSSWFKIVTCNKMSARKKRKNIDKILRE